MPPILRAPASTNVIITGRAKRPSVLVIGPERPYLREAGDLWGADTFDTNDALKASLGLPKASVIGIGPAGVGLLR